MVQRASIQGQNPVQLKPAAAMTEAGDLRDLLNLRWSDTTSKNDTSIQKVFDHFTSHHCWAKQLSGECLPHSESKGNSAGTHRYNFRSKDSGVSVSPLQ